MPTPVQNTQIVAQGLARLTSSFITQPNVRAMLGVYLRPLQDLENAIWGVITGRILRQATIYALPTTNAALDTIGSIVGQPREGLADQDYIALIYLRVAVNRAQGKISDWSRFAAILLKSVTGPVAYREGTAELELGVWGMPPTWPNIVASLLAQAVPSGVRGVFKYSAWADGSDFTWGSRYDTTAGESGWGSRYDATQGGLLVAEVGMS